VRINKLARHLECEVCTGTATANPSAIAIAHTREMEIRQRPTY